MNRSVHNWIGTASRIDHYIYKSQPTASRRKHLSLAQQKSKINSIVPMAENKWTRNRNGPPKEPIKFKPTDFFYSFENEPFHIKSNIYFQAIKYTEEAKAQKKKEKNE